MAGFITLLQDKFCGNGAARLLAAVVCGLLVIEAATAATAEEVVCNRGPLPPASLRSSGDGVAGRQPDLKVTGDCTVSRIAPYYYGNVNILDGGTLDFEEPNTRDTQVDFWASNIIVENGGTLVAGQRSPYGYGEINGGTLTIHIYGADQSNGQDPVQNPGLGARCKSGVDNNSDLPATKAPCGVPKTVWDNNGKDLLPGCVGLDESKKPNCIPGLSEHVKDYFYQYGPLYGDNKCTDGTDFKGGKCGTGPADGKVGYFGYKVLAVSFGGTLVLRGYKGATYDPQVDQEHTNSGVSWIRLANGHDLDKGATSLMLATALGGRWQPDDEIVVTTTDYLPGHSEELTIKSVNTNSIGLTTPVKWFHNGTRFPVKSRLRNALDRLQEAGMDKALIENGAETRAAVALLSRSIRIVSAGDGPGEAFPKPGTHYYFGAHMILRQGFKKVQVQGVEFDNMGQGGKIGHYPVHFHKARRVPTDTSIKDSSINVSMTRWIVLHDTQGVTLQRNVGYKSIGHGFYLEDGTEADNNFYSNIGILARAAIDNARNRRKIPGILADNATDKGQDYFPYFSDYNHPTVFWITNGWNDFVGNMAAGAGTCGAAYWFVPLINSDSPDVPTPDNQDALGHIKWDNEIVSEDGKDVKVFGYAGLQRIPSFSGSTPFKVFCNNYATSTMNAFMTVGNTAACHGVYWASWPATSNVLKAIKSYAPSATAQPGYYPNVDAGGYRQATLCPVVDGKPDCEPAKVPDRCSPGKEAHCTVTVLDHYTSSFHWAEGNLSAIWLRNQWYLLDNSVISDVLGGGLTFITGGDYTHSSVIPGYWAVLKSSVLVGHTQPLDEEHKYANDAGPFNALSGLKCEWQKAGVGPSDYCLDKDRGISIPLATAFLVNQRLFNIYDGPAYEDSNAYLDIEVSPCTVPNVPSKDAGCIYATGIRVLGIRKTLEAGKLEKGTCFLPNAAIGWKQPNGFSTRRHSIPKASISTTSISATT